MDPLSQRLMMGAAAGGADFDPFTLTLNAGAASRLGDDATTVNSFWSGYTSPLLGSKGTQTYQGFYATTLQFDAVCDFTVGGAAGFLNTNGRSISARFTLSAGTRLVFFAGKNSIWGTTQGGGGGASCVMTWNGSSFTPLIVAAGGSASYGDNSGARQRVPAYCAVPLSTTVGNYRNNLFTWSVPDASGGIGRPAASSAGSGWNTGAYDYQGNIDPGNATPLKSGATGGLALSGGTGTGGAGGFGGGGGESSGNSYCAGGGGYWGGFEALGGGGPTAYNAYYTLGSAQDDRLGPISYVNPTGSSNVVDNGLHGSATQELNPANETRGQVVIDFSPV